ncbi:hypothetical protein OAJ94_03040 [Deltaproteobacteria bacterium]|nr:hypothetical protein [Deltaproteobacteria bacterium]
MVGELSPDGNYMWDGYQWVVAQQQVAVATVVQQPVVQQQFMAQPDPFASGLDSTPLPLAPDASGAGGGKATLRLAVIGLVGSLLLAGVGFASYEFVVDPWLDPDPYTEDKFISSVGDTPTQEQVVSGEIDGWSCRVELEISTNDEMLGEMDIDLDTIMSVSRDAALIETDMVIRTGGFPIPLDGDFWLSQEEFAMRSMDESHRAVFENMDGEPATVLLTDSDTMGSESIDFCFLHQIAAISLDNGEDLDFTSSAERFPNEDGERAVKVSMEQDVEGDRMSISWFFDTEDNLIGARATNDTGMKLLMTITNEKLSKPSWVDSTPSGPFALYLDEDLWSNYTHRTMTIEPQFNATYKLEGSQIVLYSKETDDDDNDIITLLTKVSATGATDPSGISISVEGDSPSNCTFFYNDTEPMLEISYGDTIRMECEDNGDYNQLRDYEFGLANANDQVSQKMDLEMPWVSPFMTIISIIGAVLLIRKRFE